MASWGDVVADAPDLAEAVRRTFEIRKHATLATIRRDGSPRISGSEVEFDDEAGEIYLGSMPAARKALDLLRDPRMALHCPTEDAPPGDASAWAGDGKIAGVAVDVSDVTTPGSPHRFRVDVTEVVLTRVGTPADHLVIESWHPSRGYERRTRE
jgi:hypothetical protein